MFKPLRNSRGQNTIEYVMMAFLIVALVLVVGSVFKKQIKNVAGGIGQKIESAINQMSGG